MGLRQGPHIAQAAHAAVSQEVGSTARPARGGKARCAGSWGASAAPRSPPGAVGHPQTRSHRRPPTNTYSREQPRGVGALSRETLQGGSQPGSVRARAAAAHVLDQRGAVMQELRAQREVFKALSPNPQNAPWDQSQEASFSTLSAARCLKNAARSFFSSGPAVTVISACHRHQTRQRADAKMMGDSTVRGGGWFWISPVIFQIDLTLWPLVTEEAVGFGGTGQENLLWQLLL